jgi:phosphodiesterase/alkaline phosphatase D-like protein
MSGRSAGFDFCCMCMLYLWICLSDVAGQDPVGYRRAMQGPMIGAVSEDSALIWGRFSYAFPVQVEYSTKPDFSEALRSETLTARKERDYCLTFRLDGLQPKTRYYYRFVIDEERDKYRDGFVLSDRIWILRAMATGARTAHMEGDPGIQAGRFLLAWGQRLRG